MGDTRLQREIRLRERRIRDATGRAIRDLREDAGLTRAAVAEAAGIDASFEGRIEGGGRAASLATLTAIAAVLGADLSVRLYPNTGPVIRDRIQAAMVEATVSALHRRWDASPEIPVFRPARGVIDLTLEDRLTALVVAAEFNSQLRRLEQQIRWHREKEASLPSAALWPLSVDAAPATSRLLVLRSTRELRELVDTYAATLRAAYPARARDVVDALTGERSWPGPGIAWVRVEGGRGELLHGVPRGARFGR